MSLTLTVHRSAHEIGGNCIELETGGGERLILDVGRPLDAAQGASGLMPRTLDLKRPATILISHSHQDHHGLLEEAPADWTVWSGAPTEALIRLTHGVFGRALDRKFRTWRSGQRLEIGPFSVTPLLTDHSAFDSYMILIEAEGRRLLYSGDFRRHGRKGGLVDQLMKDPPSDIDLLLLEGTNLDSDKPTISEADLEHDFVDLFRRTPETVWVAWSAQNVDRTVTLYRACKRAGRTLVVDLYTAEVLNALSPFARIPQPGWPNLKVAITSAFARLYRRRGRDAFVSEMAQHGISARGLRTNRSRWVVMTRPSLIRDYARAGVAPSEADAWSWSMWRGYLSNEQGQAVHDWFADTGAKATHLHTSGHASASDLKAFASAVNARKVVPIHGDSWDRAGDGFLKLVRLRDGEPHVV